jgi:hypothetical protein
MTGKPLLPVIGHHLVAGMTDARAISLQALQYNGVAVIHDGAAKTRDIAGAGVVALLLRKGVGRKQRQRNGEEQLSHGTPLKQAMAERRHSRAAIRKSASGLPRVRHAGF